MRISPRFVSNLLIVALWVAPGVAQGEEYRAAIDWRDWDAILREHVRDGFVDYDGIGKAPGFPQIVDAIASARLENRSRDEVLAFSINAYNVLAVKGILEGRSPRTVFGKLRFFILNQVTVAGERLSLHAFEHERIRPLGEPRIHFAIVCAAASCPPLRSEAFLPGRLDRQLEDQARRFINDPERNRFDLGKGQAHLSKIFQWFAEDFESESRNVAQYVGPYVEEEDVAQALRTGALEIRYQDYDWSLNGKFSGRNR